MSSTLIKPYRPVAWRQIDEHGIMKGPLSKVHSAGTWRPAPHHVFNPDCKMPDSTVTVCGLPIESAFNHRFGVYSSKGPVRIIEFDDDTVPLGNLCRTCFPVVKMEPETPSLFREGEET